MIYKFNQNFNMFNLPKIFNMINLKYINKFFFITLYI